MIRENILANLVTSLQAINGAGGYNYDMATVERARLTPYDGLYPAAWVFEETDEPVEEYDSTCARQMTVTIEAWIEATSEPSKAINKLYADLQKAVYTDRTRGANAVDTRPPSARFALIDGATVCGVIMTVVVLYQHAVATP